MIDTFENFVLQNVLKIVHDTDEEREAQETLKVLPQKSENLYGVSGTQGFGAQSESVSDGSNQ